MMNAVLIGSSDRSSLWRYGQIKKEEYEQFVREYAKFLSERFDNLIVTPDDGVYTDIALEYGKIMNKKPIAFYPDKDTQYGIDNLRKNFALYEVKAIDGDWYRLNAELTKQSLTVIVLGFTPSSLIELGFIKYHQKYGGLKDPELKKIHVFIDERCITEKLPKTFEEQIDNIFYYSDLDQLDKLIKRRARFFK